MMDFDETVLPARAGPVTIGNTDMTVNFLDPQPLTVTPAPAAIPATFDAFEPLTTTSFDPTYSGLDTSYQSTPTASAIPPPPPLPEPELRYTIPPPDAPSYTRPESRKRSLDDRDDYGAPSAKRPAVDMDDTPTYEKLSPEDLARQNRELDLLDYRQDLSEWIAQSMIPVTYNVDELTDDQVLLEYGKWLRVVENKQVTNLLMEGTESLVDGLEEVGKDWGADLQGLRYKFGEQREPFQGLMGRFVRRNLRTFSVPLWAQIGIAFFSMVGGVWMGNVYTAKKQAQAAEEQWRPPATPQLSQREQLMQRRANAAAMYAKN